MTFDISRTLPVTNKELRKAVFAGEIFLIPANAASKALAEDAGSSLRRGFSEVADLKKIHKQIPGPEIFSRLQGLRHELTDKDYSRKSITAIADSLGFDLNDTLADAVRLRAALHEGHLNPAARSAYTNHRDTWYANPQAQINFWIPVYDANEAETFHFYPDFFDKAIANTSADFNYDDWSEVAGFQSGHGLSRLYPAPVENLPETQVTEFGAKAGDILIFSASHLHQTNLNISGNTRYSLDFRVVSKADIAAGRGAPNNDNYSQGRAEKDYMQLQVSP